MENKSFLEKALVKAEKAMEATPEYKAFEKALKAKEKAWDAVCATDEAYEKAKKATDEAWDELTKTPAYKPYKKAFDAYMKHQNTRTVKGG